MQPSMSRRHFARLVAGASAVAGHAARAQTREVKAVISAVYRKSFEAYVVPKMKELHGIDVVASTFLSSEALARAIAQRNNPTIGLFTLDEGPWLQGKAAGLWQTLDPAKVPNLADVFKNYRDPDGKGAALFNYMLGLLYDQEALAANNVPMPTSFFDMWDAAYRGRVTIPQFSSTFAFATLAETNRLLGGDPNGSFDKAFAKLKQLKPNIRTFVGPAGQYIQLFQQKEIWLTFGAHFTALQASRAGLPVAWRIPKEGALAMSHFVGVPQNAPNPDDVAKLANLMFSPEYQKQLAQIDYMGPVNSKTQLDPSFAATFPITKEATENAAQVPWAAFIQHRVELGDRWQREIQQ